MSVSGATYVNCHADFIFRVKARIAVAGALVAPGVGELENIRCRLATTPIGAAIDPQVDVAAIQHPTEPEYFEAAIDQTILEAFVLPLGVGTAFYAIWSKPNDADMLYHKFLVTDRTLIP